jgi:hypothetical protein
MPPVLFRSSADVICAPVIDADIGEGDHPSDRGTAPMIGEAV